MNDNQHDPMNIKETLASTSDMVNNIINLKKGEIEDFKEEIETISQDLYSKTKELEVEIEALSHDSSYDEIKDLKKEIEILSQNAYSEIEFLKTEIEYSKEEIEYSKEEIEELEESVAELDILEAENIEEDDSIPITPISTAGNLLGVLGKGASWVGKKTWSGVKKGTKYAWDHKEEWFEKGLEKQEQRKKNMYKKRDDAYRRVQNEDKDTLLRNSQRIKEDFKNGKTLSVDDKFYIKAAKEKLSEL